MESKKNASRLKKKLLSDLNMTEHDDLKKEINNKDQNTDFRIENFKSDSEQKEFKSNDYKVPKVPSKLRDEDSVSWP